MNNLYFERSTGEFVLVEKDIVDNPIPKIKEYVKKLNPKYEFYYIRTWNNGDKDIVYDVGSHTEFFHLKKEED